MSLISDTEWNLTVNFSDAITMGTDGKLMHIAMKPSLIPVTRHALLVCMTCTEVAPRC